MVQLLFFLLFLCLELFHLRIVAFLGDHAAVELPFQGGTLGIVGFLRLLQLGFHEVVLDLGDGSVDVEGDVGKLLQPLAHQVECLLPVVAHLRPVEVGELLPDGFGAGIGGRLVNVGQLLTLQLVEQLDFLT